MDIQNWLNINLGPIKWQSNDTEMTVNCPFCQNDTGFHLNVHVTKTVCNCFRCGYTGSWYDLVKEVSGAESAAEIIAQINNPTALPISDYVTVAERLALQRKAVALEAYKMPGWFVSFSSGEVSGYGAVVLEYALTRLSLDHITQYNLGYCNDPNLPEALRLVIPIEDGYYQARSIQAHYKPKYTNPVWPVGGRLFNHPALIQHRVVIVAEGAISAIACGVNAVATLGNKANPVQLQRLAASAVERFIIAYDAGFEHSKHVIELAEALRSAGKLVTIRQYLEGDPADNTGYAEVEYGSAYLVRAGNRVQRRR